MEKLELKLINCYGIQALDYEYDFGLNPAHPGKNRNGLMKFPFAKTFGTLS